MKKVLLFLTLLFALPVFSQTDTIISKSGKTIIGTITLVNDNNIFYNTKKSEGNYIGLDEVSYYSKSGKPTTLSKSINSKEAKLYIPEESKVSRKGKGFIIASGVSLIASGVLSIINSTANPTTSTDVNTIKNRSIAQGGFIILAGTLLSIGISFTF